MPDESPKEEILVNVTPSEVRAALLENGVLQEVFVERTARRGLISNIYKGRVSRVLPGMQAAFVDIGLDRTAFLHASDIARQKNPANGDDDVPLPDIRDLVQEGEEVLVQVMKDPLGNKGARLTTFITLPSRYLVLLADGNNVGVSARIEDEDERERLRQFFEELLAGLDCGVIVRTAAEGASDDALRADMKFLRKLWTVVQEQCRKGKVKTLVHEDLPLPARVMRDLVTSDVGRIRVDSEEDFNAMKSFAGTFLPEIEPMIEHYTRRRPIFDLHGTEDEIKKALDRSIPLKSGGYVIFDQTESMTTVDVNTGGYVGHRNLEETIYRTNLEAAVTIARQLRLRNLGGIIIIDFIEHRFPNRAGPAGIVHLQLEIRQGDHFRADRRGVGEVAIDRARGHVKFFQAGPIELAVELHILLFPGGEARQSPGDHLCDRVDRVAVAGRQKANSLGQTDFHFHGLGGCRARIVDPEIVGCFRAGVFPIGSTPIYLQFRFSAEYLLDNFGLETSLGGGDGLYDQFTRLTGREFQFEFLDFLWSERAHRVRGRRRRIAARRNQTYRNAFSRPGTRIAQYESVALGQAEEDFLGTADGHLQFGL